MSREPKYYVILQPDDNSANSWILILETPGNGPDCHIGIYAVLQYALERASDFDDYIGSAQHWRLIGTHRDPSCNEALSNINREQLR